MAENFGIVLKPDCVALGSEQYELLQCCTLVIKIGSWMAVLHKLLIYSSSTPHPNKVWMELMSPSQNLKINYITVVKSCSAWWPFPFVEIQSIWSSLLHFIILLFLLIKSTWDSYLLRLENKSLPTTEYCARLPISPK